MPTPPLFDVAALVQPISSGDSPAGVPLPHGVRTALDKARPPSDATDDEAREADWHSVYRLALDTLANTSKDILVAARLTEAATWLHGVAGLRDGARLLTAMVRDCWDRMYPAIGEDNDAGVRLGPINFLNDKKRAARLPRVVLLSPVVTAHTRGGDVLKFSYLEWQDPERRPNCQAVIQAARREEVQTAVEDLRDCLQALRDLTTALDEPDRLAGGAPGLASADSPDNLGQAVIDCLKLAEGILTEKGGWQDPNAAATADPAPGTAAPGGVPGVAAAGSDRVALYRQLEQTAAALRRLEPHSPIPFLIQRAVKLGELEFPDLMKKIIHEGAALDELSRLLGIEPPSE